MKHAAIWAGLWLASTGMAAAQPVSTGNEVSVNPVAGNGGVLLYPGGQYMRVVHPALEPGERVSDLGPIRLHPPGRSGRHIAAAVRKAAPHVAAVVPKKPVRQAVSAPAAPLTYDSSAPPQGAAALGSLGGFGGPPSSQIARANPPPASALPPPTGEAPTPGLSKRSVILFAHAATDPAQAALGDIKFLAGDLAAALNGPTARVQLMAFGGNKGDKGSDARRLSLKRALSIRQVLIDDGVPAERIDVRAMGGVDDSGPADRVDVYVRA